MYVYTRIIDYLHYTAFEHKYTDFQEWIAFALPDIIILVSLVCCV